ARLRADRRGRTREQSGARDLRVGRRRGAAGFAADARRAERQRAARGDPRPARAVERAARRVQHDSDSAARRRQRARGPAATLAGVGVQPDPPVRVPAAVRARPHRCLRTHRRSAVSLHRLLASDQVSSAKKVRVVSGMRPTGRLHVGHLAGALSNWVAMQEQYDCFYFVADWHALTSDFADTSRLTSYTYDNVADWIAAGLDPEKSTFFVQSLIPEHAELYLLLSMVVPVPWLERVPTYKEQQ